MLRLTEKAVSEYFMSQPFLITFFEHISFCYSEVFSNNLLKSASFIYTPISIFQVDVKFYVFYHFGQEMYKFEDDDPVNLTGLFK